MKFLNEIKASNNNILDVRKLGFEITNTDLPLEVGETKYDPDAETLITRITEADYLRHGQMQILKVRNNTGSSIPKGSAVYVTGGITNSPILLVDLANNNEIEEAERFIGLTTTTIANNSFGKVITSGVIEDLNLPSNEWEVGECAYITTNGGYVSAPPEKGLIEIRVGIVIRVGNDTGAILVFSRFQSFLEMLSDVSISDPQSGDILQYDSEFGIWANAQPETIELIAESVDFDNTTGQTLTQNVQAALDQIFYMFKFFTLELDGSSSGVFYNTDLDINGGLSNAIFGNNFDSGSSQIVQLNTINGGVSADYNINLLNAGFSDTEYTDTINSGQSLQLSEDTINGGES